MLNESLFHLGKYCGGWHRDNPDPQKTDLKERWRGDRKIGLGKKKDGRRGDGWKITGEEVESWKKGS